jgi:hypothetical protein
MFSTFGLIFVFVATVGHAGPFRGRNFRVMGFGKPYATPQNTYVPPNTTPASVGSGFGEQAAPGHKSFLQDAGWSERTDRASTSSRSRSPSDYLAFDHAGLAYDDPDTGAHYDVLFSNRNGRMALQDEDTKQIVRPSREVIEAVRDYYADSWVDPDDLDIVEKFLGWADEKIEAMPYARESAPEEGNNDHDAGNNERTERNVAYEYANESENRDGLVRIPPVMPWDSQFDSFAGQNTNFDIVATPLAGRPGVNTGQGVANLISDGHRDPRDILFITDGTNDTAINSYRQHFANIGAGDNVCNVINVNPDLENCVDSWIAKRRQKFNLSEADAKKDLEVVMAGHGWAGTGGRISLGGGNWTVHPNKSLGTGEAATYNFLGRMTQKGYEFSNVSLFSCDTGAGTSANGVAGVQKLLALLPGNPTVYAYDGTVLTSPNYTAVVGGHNEIAIRLKPSLVYETDLASLNDGRYATY